MALRAMQQWAEGTGQGWASTFTSRRQQPRQPCSSTASYGSPRTWQRRKQGQPSPRGYVWSTDSEERVGPQASWSPWPLPWLFEAAGQQAHHPRWIATGVAGTGVLGSPTMAVWRSAHTGQTPMLSTLGVLASPPWLFVSLLASRAAKPALAECLAERGAYGTTKGIIDRARGVCSAPHPQGLSCQRATCTPQWLTREGTEAPQGVQPPTGSLIPAGSASTARRATVQGGKTPSSKHHTPAGTC